MKKALIAISLLAGSILITSAQVGVSGTIQIGGGTSGNGGQVIIGQNAAQNQVNGGALISLIQLAQNIINRLGYLMIGLAILAFFFYLVKYIFQDGGGKEKGEALKGIAFSILAIFVMVSIWGIVGFLGSLVGIGQGGSVPVPVIPGIVN